jgi:hypothetical protein
MRFALLGHSSSAIPLLDAIAASDDHSVTVLAELDDAELSARLQQFPSARVVDSWEEVLTESKVDRVIVAGDYEGVTTGARQIATERIPVLLCPQAGQGSAFVYGLSLVHDDNQVPLFPINGFWAESICRELEAKIKDESLGEVSLLRLERSIEPLDSDQELLTQPDVDHALLGDVMLLRKMAGAFNRVTAVYTGVDGEKLSQATVTLAGEEIPEATWTGSIGSPLWKLTVVGSDATATLTLDSVAGDHQLVINPKAGERITINADQEASRQLLIDQATAEETTLADWQETIRSFETVEATHASLRRRRTIDLYFETTSERSIFKSQMTAAGCGLIMLTLFGLVAFLLLGTFLDSRTIAQRRAQADSRVVAISEWEAGSAKLTPHGEELLDEIVLQLKASPRSVFIMPLVGDEFQQLNDHRLTAIVKELIDEGRPEAVQFVEFAKVPSALTQTLLEILRLAWIAPLVLFLILQTLLIITRPSAREQSDALENTSDSDTSPDNA